MPLNEETLFLTVRALGERLRKKEISPVELTRAYLERLEKLAEQTKASPMPAILPNVASRPNRPATYDDLKRVPDNMVGEI